MQIVHKINDFLYTIFPELENANEKEIINAIQKYYTYGPFVPKVSIKDGIVTIDVDTEYIITQDADYNKTVALCEKGKFDDAKIILEKLIQKNPSNSEFHRILGQILSEQGDQDEAINALIDALRWNSSNGWGLLMMGNIFAKHKKDLKTALIYYDQAILANKADHITLANIAYLLFQENKLEEAKKYAWETIKLNEKYPNAHFILSLIAQSENDLHSAFYSTLQAIKFSTQKDALYQNAVKQAFEVAKVIAGDFDGKKIFFKYRSQLEAEGGTEIDIYADDEIKTAAKVEIAERYNRSKHIVKYKSTYPAVEHLVMHELVHLDFVNQARKENLNQVFISTQQNKNNFIETILPAINNLKSKIQDPSTIDFFIESIFSGLNLQTYNTPIDVFIEDFLYKEYAELRPFQFLSLFGMLQDAIKAVTDERILDIAPQSVISKTRTFSLVNAMQFKELFGMDTLEDFKPTPAELNQAGLFYKGFVACRDHRKPGQEYELVQHWAQQLGLDPFFELESETQFETKTNIDDFLNQLQQDPFGLNDAEDAEQAKEMADFQKSQEALGLNYAVVQYMVAALQYFQDKDKETIKKIAFEIAMMGSHGIDTKIDNYIVGSFPNQRFSGYQLLAYYYVSWALAVPEHVGELGLDYKEEFELAKQMK
jgi:tetratricopeptide (TPR) repeat protein